MERPGADGGETIRRFDRTERAFHWLNAACFVGLSATAAVFWIPGLSAAVGNRNVVRAVHEVAGLAVVGLVVLVAGPWGRGLRRDLRELESFDADDGEWLRRGLRHGLSGEAAEVSRQGKFNAGQKLNAAVTAALTVVLVGTGGVMFWNRHFPLWLKQGANLTHNLAGAVLVLIVAGHVVLALRDRESLRGMLTGRVRTQWASSHHGKWVWVHDSDRNSSC